MKSRKLTVILLLILVIIASLAWSACVPAPGSEYYVEPNPYSDVAPPEYVPNVRVWKDPSSDVVCFIYASQMECLRMGD